MRPAGRLAGRSSIGLLKMVFGNHRWKRQIDPISAAFDKIYRTREWGFGSGEGSNPEYATPYIRYIENFLKDKNIRSVLDCGCGDLQIASTVDWGEVDYLGIETSQEALALAETRIKPGLVLKNTHISSQRWSRDLALVKEVFQHLPFFEIGRCLQSLSCCKYVLVTNDFPGKAEDIPYGHYRPIDIRKNPLNVKAEPVLTYVVGETEKLVLLITND